MEFDSAVFVATLVQCKRTLMLNQVFARFLSKVPHHLLLNCNSILFTKLHWPGDSEVTFRSLSQASSCPPVYHTRRRLHTVSLIPERQAGKIALPPLK